MRAQARRITHEEEEESAFVSMTDMTVGFLFIMMILLAFFVSQIREPDAVSRVDHEVVLEERDYWRELAITRAETITNLEATVADLTAQKATLEAELERYIQLLRVALLQVDTLENLNSKLQAQKEDLEARNTELQARIENLETVNSELRSQKEDLEARNAELQARVESLEIIIANLRKLVAEMDREIEQLKAEISRLQQVDPLEEYLARVADVRREVLTRLRDAIRLDFPDLQVELSEESDALRFQGEGLFASGSSNLTTQKSEIVARLAQRLDEVLPCFTVGERSEFSETCNPGFVMIEAVQIEGHTDNVGSDAYNRTLSTSRANNTFFAMTDAAPLVMDHRNLKMQPVLSVAAYGPDRPVATNETPAGRATNRRIDLRFIMVTPQDTDGINTIRNALETLSGVIE